MKNFIVSTDSCVDLHKSYLEKHGVYYIIMKRVLNGKEVGEIFNSEKEFDAFYEALKKGAKPTTVAINPFELEEHFKKILAKEKTGDIIHIPLSSGLSVTCENAIKVAEQMNKTLTNRKIYIIDSLLATGGMDMHVDELIALRDAGKTTKEAVKQIETIRDRQQAWVIMSDLFHLRRGGRISGVKATIGTILNIKPIIIVNHKGKLVIENKMRGTANAINYLLSKLETLGEKALPDFLDKTVYVMRTSSNPMFDELVAAIKKKYPGIKLKQGIVGPIIGTHLGCGGAAVVFQGAKRLEISDK